MHLAPLLGRYGMINDNNNTFISKLSGSTWEVGRVRRIGVSVQRVLCSSSISCKSCQNIIK